jgi:predicted metal-dependent hydrolase
LSSSLSGKLYISCIHNIFTAIIERGFNSIQNNPIPRYYYINNKPISAMGSPSVLMTPQREFIRKRSRTIREIEQEQEEVRQKQAFNRLISMHDAMKEEGYEFMEEKMKMLLDDARHVLYTMQEVANPPEDEKCDQKHLSDKLHDLLNNRLANAIEKVLISNR